jgi:hypothetical protein
LAGVKDHSKKNQSILFLNQIIIKSSSESSAFHRFIILQKVEMVQPDVIRLFCGMISLVSLSYMIRKIPKGTIR